MSVENDRALYERVTILETWREAQGLALLMQAKEYERRLADLNNEHARHERALITYVGRAEWEADKKVTAAAIVAIEKWRSYVIGFAAAFAIIGGIVGGIIARVLVK